MERGVVLRGRLRGRHIELNGPADDLDGEVEVVVRPVEPPSASTARDIFDFIRSLPAGTRTKDDIDRQIAEERDAWGSA